MDVGSILGTIISTTIGIIATAIFAIKFSKSKKPVWCCKLNVLFSKGISEVNDLQITYKQNKVNNLSSVYVSFWNNGKETIKKNEIAEKILLFVQDSYIYNAEVVSSTSASNDFCVSISEDKKSVELSFKYLDYKQGAVIQIFTDCTSIKKIKPDGKIMGCRKFDKIRSEKEAMRIWFVIITVSTIILSVIITVMILLMFSDKIKNMLYLGISISSVIFWAFLVIFLREWLKPKSRLPKDFKKFFN